MAISISGDFNPYEMIVKDDKKSKILMDDFFNLMAAQMQNQDMFNPVDDTQFLTQMAQFAQLQEMESMAYATSSNTAISMIGKTALVSSFDKYGNIESFEGVIDKVSLVDGEFRYFIGDKTFGMQNIMEIKLASKPKPEDPSKPPDTTTPPDPNKPPDPTPPKP
ncbi:MAG: flagellar hook capping FlgD N-terminal domain-containing protein [Oscillospiraceae bacterium]